mmetsp:Transcript_26201/g.57630  ORF Transcript_26201/g.57630 Transcript_26201/m.57630 type:complete len:585 (+) Transcript_26201:447-2201(+)
MRHLAGALVENSALTELRCNSNKIGDEGMRFLAFALTVNQGLRLLDLSDNGVGENGAHLLASGLKGSRIEELLLGCNYVSDRGAQHLADALRPGLALRTLRLYGNRIGDAGARRLADALARNAPLQTLDLSDNRIGDAGASRIADALRRNHVLRTLQLSCNHFGEQSAARFADALHVNRSLARLDLGRNQLGNAGALHLSGALRKNEGLRELGMTSCGLGQAGLLCMHDALAINTALRTLELSGNIATESQTLQDIGDNLLRRPPVPESPEAVAIQTEVPATSLAAEHVTASGKSNGPPQRRRHGAVAVAPTPKDSLREVHSERASIAGLVGAMRKPRHGSEHPCWSSVGQPTCAVSQLLCGGGPKDCREVTSDGSLSTSIPSPSSRDCCIERPPSETGWPPGARASGSPLASTDDASIPNRLHSQASYGEDKSCRSGSSTACSSRYGSLKVHCGVMNMMMLERRQEVSLKSGGDVLVAARGEKVVGHSQRLQSLPPQASLQTEVSLENGGDDLFSATGENIAGHSPQLQSLPLHAALETEVAVPSPPEGAGSALADLRSGAVTAPVEVGNTGQPRLAWPWASH